MNAASNWKITFDPDGVPRLLLAYGDEIDAELSWSLRKGLEVVNLVDSDAPFLRPSGNNVIAVAFRVYTDETVDKTGRQKVMESLIAIDPLGRKPLKIEVNGITDRYWKATNSFITEHTPYRLMEGASARIVKSYSITATKLVQVAVP